MHGDHDNDEKIRTRPITGTQCPTLTRQTLVFFICPVADNAAQIKAVDYLVMGHLGGGGGREGGQF